MGGVLHDNEPLVEIRPGSIVSVKTFKQRYTTPRLILCLGAWTRPVLQTLALDLPLQPLLLKAWFWESNQPELYKIDSFPAIIASPDEGADSSFGMFGLPTEEYPNLFKFCFHEGPPVDPDCRDSTADQNVSAEYQRITSEYLQKHFRGFRQQPSIVENCLYTMTPDKHFIIDRHPSHANIVVGAGFSGSGFKHAPTVGAMLVELALDQLPAFDMSRFKIDRTALDDATGRLAKVDWGRWGPPVLAQRPTSPEQRALYDAKHAIVGALKAFLKAGGNSMKDKKQRRLGVQMMEINLNTLTAANLERRKRLRDGSMTMASSIGDGEAACGIQAVLALAKAIVDTFDRDEESLADIQSQVAHHSDMAQILQVTLLGHLASVTLPSANLLLSGCGLSNIRC